jgi:hypothetical protein
MTTPVKYKSMKVSPEIHQQVHDLAERLETSADGAISHLFNSSTVRLDLTETQHARWQAYADAVGVSLAQWVVLRCEAAMQYGADKGSIGLVLDHVRALTQAAGIEVRRHAIPVRVPRPAPTEQQED